MEKQHMPLVYYAIKLLIKKYSIIKKDLIALALEVFLDKTKVHVFLNLEEEWQKEWLIFICEEVCKAKNKSYRIHL